MSPKSAGTAEEVEGCVRRCKVAIVADFWLVMEPRNQGSLALLQIGFDVLLFVEVTPEYIGVLE